MAGYRKLTLDMRDLGECCGEHRVARLLKLECLRSQTGYGGNLGCELGSPQWLRKTTCSASSRWSSSISLGS